MSTKISEARHLPGPPVAFNTQDWWVTGGTLTDAAITVGTIHGEVFEHHIVNNEITPAKKYSGPRMAFRRPVDQWVVKHNNVYNVGLCDGSVFSQAIKSTSPNPVLADAIRLSGPPVAASPEDKRALAIGSNLVVITHDGRVFAHTISGSAIGPAFKIPEAHVAFRTADRWVFSGHVSGSADPEIFVITSEGAVFAHTVKMSGGAIQSISEPVKLDGPGVGFRTQDRWVVMSGGKFVVITEDGAVFANDVS